MPRKRRQDTVGEASTHHIVQRSVNRCVIFPEARDYNYFKSLIRRYMPQHEILIYNYCLMPNHVHMLLYTKGLKNLSKFIQSLALAYGAYFRNTYDYSGYLWQGRYKNFPVTDDEYLLECARYIERNPIGTESVLVDDIDHYKWSSYNFYANGTHDDIVTKNPLFDTIRDQYREYVVTPRGYELKKLKGPFPYVGKALRNVPGNVPIAVKD